MPAAVDRDALFKELLAQGLLRHTPGGHQHNQLSHAGDLLNLAGRIELGDGETFVSSGRVDLSDPFPEMLYAVVDTPNGQRVRVGIIPNDDAGKWRAGNKGGTADLDTGQIRQLRTELTDANDRAKRSAKAADKAYDSGSAPTDPALRGEEPVAEGRLRTAWGDLTWSAWVTDDEPSEWQTVIGVDEDSDNARLDPKDLKKLLDKLDELSGAQRSAVRAEPQGGQFALGGGRVGAQAKAAKPQRRKKAAPGSVLGYNPKTGQGTGYGSKSGDSRVRGLQEALNKLGLTDSSGKPLKVDGKLGPKTTAAIKRLQEQLGMTANGRVTPLFLSKITGAESVAKLKASIQKPAAKPATRAVFLQTLSSLLLEDHIVRHPGHPNQKVHGRRGPVATLRVAVEGAIAEALNSGGSLDLDDPEQREVARGIRSFTDCSSTRLSDAGVPFLSHADLIEEIKQAQTDPAASTTGALLARTVAAAPPNAPKLYRGMYEVSPDEIPAVGESVDLGLSSFTSDPLVAENFSVPSFQQTPDRVERSVLFELAPGSRSLSVEKHAGDYAHQKEWITTGRFRVVGRSTRMLGEELGYEPYEAVVLEVEQVA